MRYVMLFASMGLILANYTYLTIYSNTKDVSILIYPLLITLTSNHSENTVISLDWGQLAMIFVIYRLLHLYFRGIRQQTSTDSNGNPSGDRKHYNFKKM
ncbi:MAG: hypothetical protein QXZ10_00450 [Sulfolobales archaeon]